MSTDNNASILEHVERSRRAKAGDLAEEFIRNARCPECGLLSDHLSNCSKWGGSIPEREDQPPKPNLP